MNISEQIAAFDSQIENAYLNISKQVMIYEEKDKNLLDIIKSFNNNFGKNNFIAENNYETELLSIIKQYENKIQNWSKGIQNFIEGKEFISKFEKSILVIVFGDVNVGKSSVGNIIAGTLDRQKYSIQDIEMMKSYYGETPQFYEYDLAGKSVHKGIRKNDNNYFKEGTVETTANIQYFTRKNGLTWTDSPGIHSVNKENEELAKQYVEYADLVIFITTSSSPAKRDEFLEMEHLFGKKKPVLVVINKSDIFDKDEIDGKIVTSLIPKSMADRNKQEKWISDLFIDKQDNMFSKVDAISFSTYLVIESLRKQDNTIFEASGLPRLYSKLGNILSDNAVSLKMRAPKDRINSAIEEIIQGGNISGVTITGINQFISELNLVKEKVDCCKKSIHSIKKKFLPEVFDEIFRKVDTLVLDTSMKIRNGKEESIDVSSEINELVIEITVNILDKKIKEILDDSNNDIKNTLAFEGVKTTKVNAIIETFDKKVYTIEEVSRKPDGLIEILGSILFDKKYTRGKVKEHIVSERYKNGDNTDFVLLDIHNEIERTIDVWVSNYLDTISENYFKQEEKIIMKMIEDFQQLTKCLEKEKIK